MDTFKDFIKKAFKPIKDIEYDAEALKQGIKIEMEHTKLKSIATIIAKAHLAEDPKYYSKLKKVEKKGS